MQTFLTVLVFLAGLNLSQPRLPLAQKGVADLREIRNTDHFVLKLNGEWEFYWKEMLHPHDFEAGKNWHPYYAKVPSYWSGYNIPNIESKGYGTYRLRVLLPPGYRDALAVDLPVFDSAFDIYINGKYIGSNGTPGKSEETTTPEYRRVFARIVPDSGILEIVINVANYHHRRGGFWLPLKLGTFPDVQKRMANTWAAEWCVFSILAGFSLFFLFFFILAPGEKTMLYFSLLCAGLALRPLFTAHYLINNLFDLSWEWIVKLEYIDLFIITLSAAWFARYLYPTLFAKISARGMTILFIPAGVFVLFSKVNVFSYLVYLLYLSLLLLMAYLLITGIKGAVKKKSEDIAYTFAFVLLIGGGINDIMVSLGMSGSGSGYIMSYLVVIFMFLQAIFLLYKWITAFREKEKLQRKMEYMNKNLEKLVNQRTGELQRRNEEIEQQNRMIALQNRELSDTIQLKNRMFSVIAHDLRSPVVNILYMLNLLKEKEYKEKYDMFANSSINYAQRVIGLLENMLVWGRGQEEKIKFSPGNHDLADIILTNLSIIKESADKKEISVGFTQVGSSIAFCDRDLLDIIIRNIFSNAVKYTPRKGRISIFLKDKKNTGEGIMLKICDNGVGIPEDKQKRIFTSEEIESTPGTENEKGTGIGLKLCHELVTLNNGQIAVESKVNEGTCFIITLPA